MTGSLLLATSFLLSSAAYAGAVDGFFGYYIGLARAKLGSAAGAGLPAGRGTGAYVNAVFLHALVNRWYCLNLPSSE